MLTRIESKRETVNVNIKFYFSFHCDFLTNCIKGFLTFLLFFKFIKGKSENRLLFLYKIKFISIFNTNHLCKFVSSTEGK